MSRSEPQYRRPAPSRKIRVRAGLHKTKLLLVTLCVLIVLLLVLLLVALVGRDYGGQVSKAGEIIELNMGSLGKIWLPVLPGLEKNTYAAEDFVADGNFISYQGRYGVCGVDVSAHSENIDWAAVAAEGVEFAMIRVGYRGYGNGDLVEDDYFHQNIEGAQAAGLDVGVYFFSQAISEEEALAEAEMTLAALEGYTLQYPVVFDWETVGVDTARTGNIDPVVLTDCAVAFCERVQEAGYTPMFYASQLLALLKYDLSRLADYDFWLAEYADYPDFYYNFQMWQYSEEGTVNGIPGNVDLNICFVQY